MTVRHRILRLIVAFLFGIVAAYGSFQWITDNDRSARRLQEEAIVVASRDILRAYIGEDIETSDALERVRAAGKVYLFPTETGWELSGHYRRDGEQEWHAYLMALDGNVRLVRLSVQDGDPELAELAVTDPKLSTSD